MPDLADVSSYADAFLSQQQLGNSSGGDAGGCLPGRRAPPSPVIAGAIFGLVGKVSMRRPKFIGDMAVVFGAGIGIVDDHGDGGAGTPPMEDARQDFCLVFFLALGDDFGLPRPPPCQFLLHEGLIDFQPGRAAVEDHTDGAAM